MSLENKLMAWNYTNKYFKLLKIDFSIIPGIFFSHCSSHGEAKVISDRTQPQHMTDDSDELVNFFSL